MKKGLFIFYPLFLVGFTIFSYAFVDPNLNYLKNIYTGFAFDHRIITTIIYIFLILLFFIIYIVFLKMIKDGELTALDVKKLIILTVGILFFSYAAMLSYDIFNYILTAKVSFFYQENPYVIMPIELTDPFLLFTRAANKLALYGPFWIILTFIPHILGFNHFILTFFSFKLLIVPFYIGITYFIWKISKNLFSVVFFALNPLVIIETLVSGHNDIVMMFLALFSFFLLMKKKILLSILLFLMSIFIKYATIFLTPIFLYILWKTLIDQKIKWQKIYFLSFVSMFIVFILSPIREEIYPWYAIWFLTFVSFIPEKKIIFYTSLIFSFSLLFRYTPYLFSGTYLGQTPVIKTIVSFVPPILFSIYYGILKKKI